MPRKYDSGGKGYFSFTRRTGQLSVDIIEQIKTLESDNKCIWK